MSSSPCRSGSTHEPVFPAQAFQHGAAAGPMPMQAPYWTYIMAVSTVATLPVVIVFLLLQRYFIEGVVVSGLKG